MSDTIQTICKACGGELTLQKPDTGDGGMDRQLMNIAKGVVHDECKRIARFKRETSMATLRLHQRAATWGKLCEPFYQSSEEWIATNPPKVNLKMINKAQLWQYGPKGLLLFGKTSGTGKTTAAWLVLKTQFDAGKIIAAMSHGEFARQATWLQKENSKESIEWSKMVAKCDLLFIDDLGKSKFMTLDGSGKAAEEFLFDLIDSRMRKLLPCILTTNNDGDGLKAKLSEERAEPFLRRLRENCNAINFDAAPVK